MVLAPGEHQQHGPADHQHPHPHHQTVSVPGPGRSVSESAELHQQLRDQHPDHQQGVCHHEGAGCSGANHRCPGVLCHWDHESKPGEKYVWWWYHHHDGWLRQKRGWRKILLDCQTAAAVDSVREWVRESGSADHCHPDPHHQVSSEESSGHPGAAAGLSPGLKDNTGGPDQPG